MMHWRTSNKISAYIKMRTLMGTCHPKLQVFCKDLETEGSQVYDVAHSCRLLYTVVLYSVSWVTFNQDSKPTMDLMLESAHVSVHSTCSCHLLAWAGSFPPCGTWKVHTTWKHSRRRPQQRTARTAFLTQDPGCNVLHSQFTTSHALSICGFASDAQPVHQQGLVDR